MLYGDWQANADATGQTLGVPVESAAASSLPADVQTKQERKNPFQSSSGQAQPAAFIKAEMPGSILTEEQLQSELRKVYTDWALSAVRGNWKKHASFYAGKVEYFRDGSMTREKVEARKRNIFGKLDSYWLKFSESPEIVLKNFNGQQEADLSFDRSWTLSRGRKQSSGRARGLITLRREEDGWQIISEKQVKK